MDRAGHAALQICNNSPCVTLTMQKLFMRRKLALRLVQDKTIRLNGKTERLAKIRCVDTQNCDQPECR